MRLGSNSPTGAELYGAMDRKDTEARKFLFFYDANHTGPESKQNQRRTAGPAQQEARDMWIPFGVQRHTVREFHYGVPQRTKPSSKGTKDGRRRLEDDN